MIDDARVALFNFERLLQSVVARPPFATLPCSLLHLVLSYSCGRLLTDQFEIIGGESIFTIWDGWNGANPYILRSTYSGRHLCSRVFFSKSNYEKTS